MKQCESCQSSEDRQLGWRYFLEKSALAAGTDPSIATKHREMDLDLRESEAQQQTVSVNLSGHR